MSRTHRKGEMHCISPTRPLLQLVNKIVLHPTGGGARAPIAMLGGPGPPRQGMLGSKGSVGIRHYPTEGPHECFKLTHGRGKLGTMRDA